MGANTGTVGLNFRSLTNGTASSRAGGPTNVGSEVIAVSGIGYRMAKEAVSSTNINLGRFHIGATNVTGSIGITNTAINDGFSEGLVVGGNGTSGGATVDALPPGLIAAGGNTNVTVGLGGVTSIGANSGSVTLGFQSSGIGTSGLAATNIGSRVVHVVAQGYSGQAVWSTDAAGSWNNFDNWDVPGGTPGIDGVLSTNDTANFGNAISSSRTVSLNGENPVLTMLSFSNATASYSIEQGSGGGIITMGTTQGVGFITNAAGNHTVAAALALARTTEIGVSGASTLRFTGGISGNENLTKTGVGLLRIEGTNSLTGSTRVAGGELKVNGSLAGSAVIVESGASLGGIGTVGVITGAGAVGPGNSPGILTAPAVDPSGGLTFNFEFTSLNPVFSNASASVNDLLRLTSDTPFAASLTSVNTVNIYFNVGTFGLEQTYTGGFFTDAQTDFVSQIADAIFNYYVASESGGIEYNGVKYLSLNESLDIVVTTTAQNGADFAGGTTVNGQITQFQVVPEPSTYALLVLAAAGLGVHAWRRRRRDRQA